MRTLLVVALLAVSCSPAVVRDAAVYRTELDFMEQAAVQPADSLTGFIKDFCRCENGKFTTETCTEAADRVLVVKTRIGWHKAMMLYNASLSKDRPDKEPPTIPAPETLCP